MTQTAPVMTTSIGKMETSSRTSTGGDKREIRHYRIGPTTLSLCCKIPEIQSAFAHYYRPYEVHQVGAEAFRIEVIARRSPRSLRRYYHICSNGEELFVVRRLESVLPHVEWALNLTIARYLPGFYQCHAAVLAKDGVGLILPGSPGAGKSTLCAGLLRRGWDYLSDEFALIDPQTRLLHAYPKALCIKRGSFEALRRFGLPIDEGPTHIKGEKGPVKFINPLAVRPDAIAEPCPVGLVIFPEFDAYAEPILERASRAQTVFELTRVSFNFGKYKRHAFDLLADVVERAACYRLRSGDLETTCRLVETCLQQRCREVA